MIKNILESIPGIQAFPIIGLILFLLVFLGVTFWAFFKLDKKHADRMGALPLDSSPSSSSNGD